MTMDSPAPRSTRSPGGPGARPRPAGNAPRPAPRRSRGNVYAANKPDNRTAGDGNRESYEAILQRLNDAGFLNDDDFDSVDALQDAMDRQFGKEAIPNVLVWAILEGNASRKEPGVWRPGVLDAIEAAGKAKENDVVIRGTRTSPTSARRKKEGKSNWTQRVEIDGRKYRTAAAARRLGIKLQGKAWGRDGYEGGRDYVRRRPPLKTAARVTDGRISLAGAGGAAFRSTSAAVSGAERRGLIHRTPSGRYTIPGYRGAYRNPDTIIAVLESTPRPPKTR